MYLMILYLYAHGKLTVYVIVDRQFSIMKDLIIEQFNNLIFIMNGKVEEKSLTAESLLSSWGSGV